ncbi:MAG: PAS domain-containing protein, partial [Ectothiorhodospira sp.]
MREGAWTVSRQGEPLEVGRQGPSDIDAAALPLARLWVDRAGTIRAANEAAGDLLGWSAAEGGTPTHVGDLLVAEDPGVLDHLMDRARHEGGALAQDLRFTDAGGRGFRADVMVMDARAEEGDPEWFMFVLAERLPPFKADGQGETTLRHFYDLHAVGMALVAPEGRAWLGFSDRFAEILG